ncbi:MAG TPA: Uma2 family endonuclease [Coleofasciculaceae cyanobacterium]
MIMQAQEQRHYSVEEYLELEVNSEERHAYLDGEIVLMSGGTPNHNKITLNLSATLNFALKHQPYEVYVADQRLWIPSLRIFTYPDVMVMAEPIAFAEGRRDTLTNPILIAEVLSKSTRSYDKDEKFAAYRTIPSLQEYVLIDQYRLHVEQYCKTETGKWLFSETEGDATLQLAALAFQISLSDLYDKVDFSAEAE